MRIRRGRYGFNLSIWVKKRAGLNDRQFACWTEADRRDETRQRADEKQDVCVWVVVEEEIARHRHHHQIKTRERKRERYTRVVPEPKKKGWSFHQKDVVKRLGVSIRGGVPVDMLLSVPRLPLRLHSLAASRTGSKRLAREEDEEDAETDAHAERDA
jgi:hypothetical protein